MFSLKDSIIKVFLLVLFISGIIVIFQYPAKLLDLENYAIPISHTLALLIFIILIRKEDIKEDFKKFKQNKSSFLIYSILPLLSITFFIVEIPVVLILPNWSNLTGISSIKSSNVTTIIIYAVILIPVLEELLFRGLFLDSFLKIYSPVKAIIYSSVLFSIIHINPMQTLSAFLGGLIIGWLYYKTASLLPCILFHSIINSSNGFLFKYFSPNGIYFKEYNFSYILFYLICLSLLVFFILIINKSFKKKFIVLKNV